MSLQEIEVHFGKMQAVSQTLTMLAENINKLVSGQGRDVFLSVRSAWNSENTFLFEQRANKNLEEVIKAAEELHTLAKEVEKKADEIYQTEKRNLLTAKERIYR